MTYDDALRDQQRRREEQLRRERQSRDQKVISIFRRKKAQKPDVADFSYLKVREPSKSD
jgi:hypothetical protein